MTDTEKRIKLALAIGWTFETHDGISSWFYRLRKGLSQGVG